MIVGCSRSGTSFAARMLNSAGLVLPGKHAEPDDFNLHGYFENDRVTSINGDILWGSGGHWFAPPVDLRVYSYQRAQIVQLLAWLCSVEGIVGWKDPRAVLTLPLWLDASRDLKIPVHVVGVFRNPAAVANSIVRHERGAFDYRQALNAWCISNTRLLDLADAMPDRFSWFTVDQPAQHSEANLNRIAAKIGLSRRVTIDQAQYVCSENASVPNTSEHVRSIHQRLMETHAAQWGIAGPIAFDACQT